MKNYLSYFKYFKPYMKYLVAANIAMILYIVFNLVSIGMLMPLIDVLFNPNFSLPEVTPEFSLWTFKEYFNYKLTEFTIQYDRVVLVQYLCVLLLFVFILKNGFHYLNKFLMARIDTGVMQDVRMDLYRHFHNLSLGYFTNEKKGTLISRIINDVIILRDSMVAFVNSMVRDPTTVILFSTVLFIFNWKLTLLSFLILPVTGFILSKIGDSLKRRSIRSQEKIADVTTILDEVFGAMRIVKAFNMQEYELKRYKDEESNYFGALLSLIRRRELASPITEVLGVFMVSILLYFIGLEVVEGRSAITPGGFILYLGIFFQMIPSIKLFGQVFNSIQEGIAASERISGILHTKPKIFDKPDAKPVSEFTDAIRFDNVDFKYDESDLILSGVSAEIKKGQVVALVGPSGAGKSSMVDLIPRFHDVTGGSVLLDGIDIRDLKIYDLRELIGIVTQETILFNDTIAANIAYGAQGASREEIIEAAKAANAHRFVSQLPKGYDTFIGDRGVKLSGGERQRISIARALLNNPPILILDEATSSLDTESEFLVQQAIERLMEGRTSVVIAHRLSTVQNANTILVIEKGKIIGRGSHAKLLNSNELYTRLYNMQFKG